MNKDSALALLDIYESLIEAYGSIDDTNSIVGKTLIKAIDSIKTVLADCISESYKIKTYPFIDPKPYVTWTGLGTDTDNLTNKTTVRC